MRMGDSTVSVSEMIFMRQLCFLSRFTPCTGNAIGLPFFLFRANGVMTHLSRWLSDPALKSQWLFLALNVVFDLICKILMTHIIVSLTYWFVRRAFPAFRRGVVSIDPHTCCRLHSDTPSDKHDRSAGALTASLVLSFQKFVGFAISVVFVNPVLRNSPRIMLGAISVLLGTVAYSAAVHRAVCKSHTACKSE